MNNKLIHYFEKAFKEGNNTSLAYKTINGIIVVLILISTLEVILSTEPSFKIYEPYLNLIFFITSCIFLLEYIFRIYIKRKTDTKFKGFNAYKNYLFNFYNLIDFIALIPFFIGLFGLYISPIWKTLRILRIFKILRYFPSVELMVNALKDKKNILLISLQSILFIALLLSIALY
jgi:voltage-gated potassium channel